MTLRGGFNSYSLRWRMNRTGSGRGWKPLRAQAWGSCPPSSVEATMKTNDVTAPDKRTTCWNCMWEGPVAWCAETREYSDKGVQDVLCCPECGKVLFRLGAIKQ